MNTVEIKNFPDDIKELFIEYFPELEQYPDNDLAKTDGKKRVVNPVTELNPLEKPNAIPRSTSC